MIHVIEKILEQQHPLLAVQELGASFLESLPAQENYCPLEVHPPLVLHPQGDVCRPPRHRWGQRHKQGPGVIEKQGPVD